MGFKLDESGTYTWPVTVEVPADGGKYLKQTFKLEFKRITQTRLLEIGKDIESGKITAIELSKEVTVGWEGIDDDNGKEIAFTQSKFKKLLDRPLVANAIGTAFLEANFGAKRKN
tara:strand:+ start:907 stop:1251 length:345 start_codon:yes stop_codon:yes gene_type:complete